MEALKREKLTEQTIISHFDSFFPTPEKMSQYDKMARLLIDSGIHNSKVPQEKWIADNQIKLMYCDAVGLPAVFAQSVYVVDGKPALMVDAMSWLVSHKCPTVKIECVKYTETEVTIRGRADPSQDWIVIGWTIEKAKNTIRNFFGREGKLTRWQTDPKAQLRSRCYSEYYRTNHQPELAGAFYTAEEMEDGIVIAPEKTTKDKKRIDDLIEPEPDVIVTKNPQFICSGCAKMIQGIPAKIPEFLGIYCPDCHPKYLEKAQKKKKPQENIPLGDPRTFSPEDLVALDKTKNFLDEPMTIEQTVDMTKELLGKKKTTKKVDIIKKEPRDPLAEIQKMGEELAKIPRDSFGHPIVQRELDVVDVGRKVQKPLFDVGTKEGKAAYDDAYMKWLSTMAVADGFYIMKDAKVIGKEGNNRLVFRNGKQSWIDQKLAYDDPDGGVLVAASWLRNHGGELF